MELSLQLERVLGLSPLLLLLEEEQGEVFTRSEWMSTDPETLYDIANTTSLNTFWRKMAEVAKEVGDQTLLGLIKERDPYILKKARAEARLFSPEKIATTQNLPKRLQRAQGAQRPEQFLGWSKEQIEDYYAQRRAKVQAQRVKKTYAGDQIYGIFDANGNQVKTGPASGGYSSQADAEFDLYNMANKFPDPEEFSILKYENPKSLSKLQDTFLPLENGWTAEEVVLAMRPMLYKMAGKYQSDKVPREDLFQQGVIGIIDALKKDAGKSPFTAFAIKKMKREMLRLAVTGGVIRGSEEKDVPEKLRRAAGAETGAAGFGQKGGLIGYNLVWIDKNNKPHMEFFPTVDASKGVKSDPGYQKAAELKKKVTDEQNPLAIGIQKRRGGMKSSDAQLGPEGPTIGSQLKATKTRSPSYIVGQLDALNNLKKAANLTPGQEEVLDLAFGLDVPEASIAAGFPPESEPTAREPGAQAGLPAVSTVGQREVGFARNAQEISKMLGKSKKRVRDLLSTALMKLYKQAGSEKSEISKQMMGEPQKVSKEMIKRGNDLMLIEEWCRHKLIRMTLTGVLFG